MKQRAIHTALQLALMKEGRWLGEPHRGEAPEGTSVFSFIVQIFKRCPWMRKDGRPLSHKSRTDYGNHILKSYADLKKMGYLIKKPWSLENRHIEALCKQWASEKLSASTIQTRLGVLSWFAAVMGRPGMVKGTHEYAHCFGDHDVQRHQAAEKDKSPEGKGFDRDRVIALAMDEDETFGHMVLLQYALGLRDKEVIRARPLRDMRWSVPDGQAHKPASEASAIEGDHWVLPSCQGSKGGRPRYIVLNQGEWQMEAIRKVQAFMFKRGKAIGMTLAQTRDASMGWSKARSASSSALSSRTTVGNIADPLVNTKSKPLGGLGSDLNRYQTLSRKLGFTRRELGFTGHGFRHSFAHAELKAHGFIPLIKNRSIDLLSTTRVDTGEAVTLADEARLARAKLATSEQLGHSRIRITNSYYGSVRVDNARKVNQWVPAKNASSVEVASNASSEVDEGQGRDQECDPDKDGDI
jgi:integrase